MGYRDLRYFSRALFLFLLIFGLWSCDSHPQKPAPIGDFTALEQLAKSYRSVAQQYSVQPASMRPAGKRKFVEAVFINAGYSFSATIRAFAKQGADATNENHRDLAELLFLPHQGMADSELTSIYSGDELEDIRSIQDRLR